MKAAGLGVEVEGPDQVEASLRHPVSMLVNALGPPPEYVVEAAHAKGVLVGALVREPAARGAQGRARGRRAHRAGHRSRRPLRRDLDDGARARGRRHGRPRRARARGRRHRTRSADGGRDRARRAGRVDRLDLAHRRRVRRGAVGGREPARGRVHRHRAVAVDDRASPRASSAPRGPKRGSGPDTPDPLPMPLQGILYAPAAHRFMRARVEGARRVRRSVRSSAGSIVVRPARKTSCSTSSTSTSTRCSACTGMDDPSSRSRRLPPHAASQVDTPQWFVDALARTPEALRDRPSTASTIHYRRWGSTERPGLVLVHGGAAHAGWWDHVAPLLAGEYCVVALDLSGHGDSGRRDTYDMETWAREVVAVAEHVVPAGAADRRRAQHGRVGRDHRRPRPPRATSPASSSSTRMVQRARSRGRSGRASACAFGPLRTYPGARSALAASGPFPTSRRRCRTSSTTSRVTSLREVPAVGRGSSTRGSSNGAPVPHGDVARSSVRCRVALFRAEHGLVSRRHRCVHVRATRPGRARRRGAAGVAPHHARPADRARHRSPRACSPTGSTRRRSAAMRTREAVGPGREWVERSQCRSHGDSPGR